MIFQSSFLIRCWLHASGDAAPAKFSIQHVQSGAEFRSSDLSEINHWMTAQNLQYLDRMLNQRQEEL